MNQFSISNFEFRTQNEVITDRSEVIFNLESRISNLKSRFVLLLVLLFAGSFAFAQEETPDCEKYKTGTFISPFGTVIKRDAEFQIETNKTSGVKIKLKVIWIDECTYRLKFVEGNKALTDRIGPGPHSDLICEIVETGEDYYYHITSDEGNDEAAPKSKLIKIDD